MARFRASRQHAGRAWRHIGSGCWEDAKGNVLLRGRRVWFVLLGSIHAAPSPAFRTKDDAALWVVNHEPKGA
jgi:hypothetical protein